MSCINEVVLLNVICEQMGLHSNASVQKPSKHQLGTLPHRECGFADSEFSKSTKFPINSLMAINSQICLNSSYGIRPKYTKAAHSTKEAPQIWPGTPSQGNPKFSTPPRLGLENSRMLQREAKRGKPRALLFFVPWVKIPDHWSNRTSTLGLLTPAHCVDTISFNKNVDVGEKRILRVNRGLILPSATNVLWGLEKVSFF